MRAVRWMLVCSGLLWIGGVGAQAENEAGPGGVDIGVLKQDLKETERRCRDLERQLVAARRDVLKSKACEQAHKAILEAEAVLRKTVDTLPAAVAARAQEQAAREALREQIDGKLAANPEAAAAQKDLAGLEAKRGALMWQKALAQFTLNHPQSPVSRAVADDPELEALKKASRRGKSHGKRAGWDAYKKALRIKVEALPEGKQLYAQMTEAEVELAKLNNAAEALHQTVGAARKALEKSEDEGIAAARQTLSDARLALKAATAGSEALVEERGAVDRARELYKQQIEAALAEDPEAAPVLTDLKLLRKRRAELEAQIQKAMPDQPIKKKG